MSGEIPNWRSAPTFHPRLIITTSVPSVVAGALVGEFRREGYRMQTISPTSTRLRLRDWFAIAAGGWTSTGVFVNLRGDSVEVEVRFGAVDRRAATRGERALNAAISSLRAQGVELAVGPWHTAN